MDQELSETIARYLKAELKKAGMTYDELAEKLTEMGMPETKPSIANKLSRGTFSATFFVAVLQVAGSHILRVDELKPQS